MNNISSETRTLAIPSSSTSSIFFHLTLLIRETSRFTLAHEVSTRLAGARLSPKIILTMYPALFLFPLSYSFFLLFLLLYFVILSFAPFLLVKKRTLKKVKQTPLRKINADKNEKMIVLFVSNFIRRTELRR